MADKDAGSFVIPVPVEDTGSKDRATVALVAAEVREVKAIVAGHAELSQTKLDAINDKIAPLATVPERLAIVEQRVSQLEADRVYRMMYRPGIWLTAVVALVAVITLITQLP